MAPIDAAVKQEGSVPFRRGNESIEEYVLRLHDVIRKLDTIIAEKQAAYLDVVNKNEVVPKSYVDEALRKYKVLMDELKRYGLYVGQELQK